MAWHPKCFRIKHGLHRLTHAFLLVVRIVVFTRVDVRTTILWATLRVVVLSRFVHHRRPITTGHLAPPPSILTLAATTATHVPPTAPTTVAAAATATAMATTAAATASATAPLASSAAPTANMAAVAAPAAAAPIIFAAASQAAGVSNAPRARRRPGVQRTRLNARR